MELSKQVVSLELAKRLRDLGMRQESYFWWAAHMAYESKDGGGFKRIDDVWSIDAFGKVNAGKNPTGENYSAFTVAELGEILRKEEWECPEYDIDERCFVWAELTMPATTKRHYLREEPDTEITEADARAMQLVYLLKNGLIGPKDGSRPRKVLDA